MCIIYETRNKQYRPHKPINLIPSDLDIRTPYMIHLCKTKYCNILKNFTHINFKNASIPAIEHYDGIGINSMIGTITIYDNQELKKLSNIYVTKLHISLSGIESLYNIKSLIKLRILWCHNIESIPFIKTLKTLYLNCCYNLKNIGNSKIETLEINNCPKLTYLPKNEHIKNLRIHNSCNIHSIPYTKLESLSIINIVIDNPSIIYVNNFEYNNNDIDYFKYIKNITKLKLTTSIKNIKMIDTDKLLDDHNLDELSITAFGTYGIYIPKINLEKQINLRFLSFSGMCVYNIPHKNLSELNISYSDMKYIPCINSLKILKLDRSNIQSISKMDNLIELSCKQIPIEKIPHFKNLKKLSCFKCKNIANFPLFEHLEILNLSDCPNINSLPPFTKLKYLDCNGTNICNLPPSPELINLIIDKCKQLKEMPNYKKLKILYCCFTNIVTLPPLKSLKKLSCSYSKVENPPILNKLSSAFCSYSNIKYLPPIRKTNSYYGFRSCRLLTDTSLYNEPINKYYNQFSGCVWLFPTPERLHKLKKLQKWFKKYIFINKLLKVLPEITKIYYTPGNLGYHFMKNKFDNKNMSLYD